MNFRKVTLLKHPNGKSPNWYLRYWVRKPDGRGYQEKWKSTRTTVRREAEAIRRRTEHELSSGRTTGAEMPWADFVASFFKTHLARKPSSTLRAYKDCLNAFSEEAAPQTLGSVDRIMLEDFVTARLNKGIAIATVNKDLRHVRAALRWAEVREYLPKAPNFRGIFVREERKVPTIIPAEDFDALMAALKSPDLQLTKCSAEWWRIFLYVSYYLGLRRGEALGLTWSDVNLVAGEVRVTAPSSKGRKDRLIPLAPALKEVLADWRRRQGEVKPRDAVLPWPFDTYRPLYLDWHAIQDAAGISAGDHYVPKNCRSSCASDLIHRDVPTAVVKEWLGHASITTTEGYYINPRPALRAAAAKQEIRLDSAG